MAFAKLVRLPIILIVTNDDLSKSWILAMSGLLTYRYSGTSHSLNENTSDLATARCSSARKMD